MLLVRIGPRWRTENVFCKLRKAGLKNMSKTLIKQAQIWWKKDNSETMHSVFSEQIYLSYVSSPSEIDWNISKFKLINCKRFSMYIFYLSWENSKWPHDGAKSQQ